MSKMGEAHTRNDLQQMKMISKQHATAIFCASTDLEALGPA